jgi:hypothetical protein
MQSLSSLFSRHGTKKLPFLKIFTKKLLHIRKKAVIIEALLGK